MPSSWLTWLRLACLELRLVLHRDHQLGLDQVGQLGAHCSRSAPGASFTNAANDTWLGSGTDRSYRAPWHEHRRADGLQSV